MTECRKVVNVVGHATGHRIQENEINEMKVK
jgi:hypothetical protein